MSYSIYKIFFSNREPERNFLYRYSLTSFYRISHYFDCLNKYTFYPCWHTISLGGIHLSNLQQLPLVHIELLSLTIIQNIFFKLLSLHSRNRHATDEKDGLWNSTLRYHINNVKLPMFLRIMLHIMQHWVSLTPHEF